MSANSTKITLAEVVNQIKDASPINKVYTGIGSRQTPPTVVPILSELAHKLAARGYTLRSGGAEGADSAFELGCDHAGGKKEIYLPWKGFNNNNSAFFLDYHLQSPQSLRAVEIATQFHPLKTGLLWAKPAVLKLMARNSQQILGKEVKPQSKTSFVICWTPAGDPTGGTRQALAIARHFAIPIFNLGNPFTYLEVIDWLQFSTH